MLPIKGIQPLSLIDYPGKLCATLFLGGCTFRCPYCYNVDLVLRPESLPTIDEEKILSFLEERKGFLDGICVGGGEPTLQSELPAFFGKVKKLGYLIKLDTNGSNPGMIKELIDKKLVDYVAMDVKAPLEKYEQTVKASVDIKKIKESIKLIREGNVDYEFRITVVPTLTEKEDLLKIADLLKNSKRFVLQQFSPGKTVDKAFERVKPYTKEKLEEFCEAIKPYFKECILRA